MSRLTKNAQSLNLWSSLLQRGWSVLDALGVKGWVTSCLLVACSTVSAVILRLWNGLPWWAVVGIALYLAILATNLSTQLREAWAIRGLKKLDLQEIGADCLKFREDVFEFLVARADTAPGRAAAVGAPEHSGGDRHQLLHSAWAAGVDYGNKTRARAVQKFAHRAIGLCHLLQTAGIRPPNLWAFDHNLPGIAAHIGAIGSLLERGLLEEARALDHEQADRLHFYLG